MASNRAIPALYQGVSQQAAPMRSLEQVEGLENCYPTVADGVRRRPPSVYVKLLSAITPVNAKVHQYFRGDGEHNIIEIHSGGIKAFDGITGTEKTVDTATFAGVLSYFDSTNSIDDIGALTVADTTYLWNRTKTVATAAASISAQTPAVFYFIREGRPDITYWITLGATSVSYSTTATPASYSTTAIAAGLKTAIDAIGASPYTVVASGPLVIVRRTDNADFTYTDEDTAGNTLHTAFKNRVERYSDLPRTFVEGVTVEVRGQGDSGGKSSFWVTFKNSAHNNTGYWEETVAPTVGEFTALDATTMPHALLRLPDGNFRLERITWNARLVGSTLGTAPVPSFVGGKVNGLFFHRERLGLLAEENAVMSRARSLYNFWPKSAALVADDDPIDVTANGTKVCILRHAVSFQRTLVLFSDNAQFPLTGGETLTGRNVRADPATEFDCSQRVSPVSSGNSLYFFYERASTGTAYSGVREYFINQTTSTNEAVDVTAHVPSYIPRDIFHASVSSTEDVLLVQSKQKWNSVFVYKYLWDGDKRVQSAWSRWTFRTSDKILAADVDKTMVHLVIQRTDGLHLERINLQATATTGSLPFQIMLDALSVDDEVFIPRVYNPILKTTDVATPFHLDPAEGEFVVVAGSEYGAKAGQILVPKSIDGTGDIYTLHGDWSASHVYFGVRYRSELELSQQFYRDKDGVPILEGRYQLQGCTVAFKNAVTFTAEVRTPGRDTAVYRYSAMQLGIIGSLIGTPVMRDGSWTFPVASDSKRARVFLVNDSPYPSQWHSAEVRGLFTTIGRR